MRPASAPASQPLLTRQRVAPASDADAKLRIDEEIVIRAPRVVRAPTQMRLGADEARRVPGTQGDTLKAVQTMPGVARAAAASGDLVVWGSAPKDTRVIVDGVEIPALYHLGGIRSTISSELVKSIELLPGGFGPAYGRAIGGLVLVETRRVPRAPTVVVSADLLDASAMVALPLGRRVRSVLAARVGYAHRTLGRWLDTPTLRALYPVPRYADAQAKLEIDVGPDQTLGATLLYSDDLLQRRGPRALELTRVTTLALSVPYRYLGDDGASAQVTPYIVLGGRRRFARFDETPAVLELSAVRYGLRATFRKALDRVFTLTIGADALGAHSNVERGGSLTRPPREGDPFAFGAPPGDDVGVDSFGQRTINVGLHARLEIALGPLTLLAGLRVGAYLLEGDQLEPPSALAPAVGFSRLVPAFGPRLSARLRPTHWLSLHAALGHYQQAPQPEELSAVFGNPTLSLSRALHALGGVELSLGQSLELRASGYYKAFFELVARSPLATPQLARALTQEGRGRSFGAQLVLRLKRWHGLSGWLSYGLSRSDRVDSEGAARRLFDFDQTHLLSLVASYALGAWTFGTRLRYATGSPRTPVVGAFYDARGDRYQPLFGARNGTRLPAFFQLDLRVERRFYQMITVYLDVQNITARNNGDEFVYNFDYTRRSAAGGLPVIAVAGLRIAL